MRQLAAFFALVTVLAVMPTAPAANECTGQCQTVPLQGSTYYVYVQGATCAPTMSNVCTGKPGPIVSGIVYRESNCEGGLQRFQGLFCAGDQLLLA